MYVGGARVHTLQLAPRKHHVGAEGREQLRVAEPDAAAAAGDERYLSLKEARTKNAGVLRRRKLFGHARSSGASARSCSSASSSAADTAGSLSAGANDSSSVSCCS